MQTIFQNRYSKSTISAITEATLEEVRRFQERSLERRYIAIFLDGLFFFLRRDKLKRNAQHILHRNTGSLYPELPNFYHH